MNNSTPNKVKRITSSQFDWLLEDLQLSYWHVMTFRCELVERKVVKHVFVGGFERKEGGERMMIIEKW